MIVDCRLDRTFSNTSPVADFKALVDSYPNSEFNSAHRSTLPLLSLVRDGRLVLNEMLASFRLSDVPSLHFEYRVPSPKGKGKASHTDLMICTERGCMALEAKWTEGEDETVGAWLDGSSKGHEGRPNRFAVLSGWLGLLQTVAKRTLHAADVMRVTYQTVHRAASACYLGTPPQFSYLQFVSDGHGRMAMREKRLTDLSLLHDVLGIGRTFPFRLVEIDIRPSPEFRNIADLPKVTNTGFKVKQVLLSRALFYFNQMHIYDVR